MKKKQLTINEVALMGGNANKKKHGIEKLREWGRRGGRPSKKANNKDNIE